MSPFRRHAVPKARGQSNQSMRGLHAAMMEPTDVPPHSLLTRTSCMIAPLASRMARTRVGGKGSDKKCVGRLLLARLREGGRHWNECDAGEKQGTEIQTPRGSHLRTRRASS